MPSGLCGLHAERYFYPVITHAMHLPNYTRKDWVMIGVLLPPAVVVMNYWIFGSRYFQEGGIFWAATAISASVAFISWMLQIVVAIKLQRRFPRYGQTVRRLVIA